MNGEKTNVGRSRSFFCRWMGRCHRWRTRRDYYGKTASTTCLIGGDAAAEKSAAAALRVTLDPYLATSWPVTVVWCAVSLLVASASLVSLVQPAWFVKTESRDHADVDVFLFGAFSFCYRVEYLKELRCHVYGSLLDLRRYPSAAWHAACVLYGSGCVLLAACALASVLNAALPSPTCRRAAAGAVAIGQAAAVVVLAVSLVLFPLGLGSPFVRHYCGQGASPFNAGECQLGWGYTLALVASVVALYCPLLASLTACKVYRRPPRAMARPKYVPQLL